jgi:signal transduction histidine kinase
VTLEGLRQVLFPTLEYEDPRFREEIERLSVIGVRAISVVCIGAPVFVYVLGAFFLPSLPTSSVVVSDFFGAMVGLIGLALSFWKGVRRYARLLGFGLGAATALVQTLGMMGNESFLREVLQTIPQAQLPSTFAIVLLIGVAVLPLKPVHTLSLGVFMLGIFSVATYLRHGSDAFQGWSVHPLIVSVLILVIAVGLTAVLYDVRAAAFLARIRAEESFQELQKAQASLLLERTAASQTRFAATLSHELNTPLGSLSSAFETLGRIIEGVPLDPKRTRAAEDAMHSGRLSYERLNAIAERMRNLTNLDRAEERMVDLNALCSDTVEFLSSEIGNARIELRLSRLPQVKCRPQQIGAVLANLVRNASSALENNGNGRIEVASRAEPRSVVLEVKDNGRGIEPDRMATLFEPAFRVHRGRVATTNWGLFLSRSIVSEHGGRLEIESTPGQGTTVRVRLPLAS